MRYSLVLVLALFLICIQLQATGGENQNSIWRFEPIVNIKPSFTLPHSPSVKAIMNGTFPIYEVGAIFPNWGTQDFKALFPNNEWGMMFSFSALTDPEKLGFGLGLFPFININILKNKPSRWTFRLATGIGYIQKPFDKFTNNKNLTIGSHMNNTTDLGVFHKTRLNSAFIVRLGAGIQHFSNGALKRPNLGLNYPYVSLQLSHRNKEQSDTIPKYNSDADTNFTNNFFIKGSYGEKNLGFGTNEFYAVAQFAGGYSWHFKRGRILHLQADFILDQSIPVLKDYTTPTRPIDSWLMGGFLFYEKKYGNIAFLFGSGLYYHSVYKTFDQDWSFDNKGSIFYNRVGVKYYATKKLFFQINVRSHTGEADNIEWGLGYNFK